MAGKGMSVGRAHGNGIGATHAPGINMAGGVASEFDRSMNKASYVDDTPVPVIVMDCEHNIEYVNRAASLMAGVAQEACVGMKMWDLFEMEACRKGNCVASHAMREGRAQAEDAECIVKGRRLLIRAHATPRYDEHNKIIGVVEVILDETVKKNDLAVLVEFGKGNFEAEAEEVDGKKAVINEHIERLRTNVKDFIEEMQHMAEEHKAGNSGVVIPEDKFEGCYRSLAKSVNDMVMGHIKVNVKTLACMKQFGEGNFEAELERFAGKGAVINETIEQVRKNLKAFIAEMEHMSEAHKTGDIDVVIPEEKFEGSYRAMAKGVNDMVMGHISVKKKAMACVAEFGKGNFEAELEKFPGKKAFINENIERLRSSVKAFIENMKIMSEAHKAGDIDVVIPEEKFEGSYRAMAKGVNAMVMGHISVKKKAMACVAEFGKGNFEAELEKFPGKKAFINENIERLRSSVKAFIEDMKIMSDRHNAGDIDMVIPEDKFEGSYRVMAKGVNDMVMGHISVKKKAMACLKQFGEGNFEAELEKFPGKKAFINDTMEQVRKNLKALIDDTDLLVDAASEEGRLDVRADATKHQGDFRRIIEGLNKSFDTIAVPFTRAIMHIEKLSHGINGAQITVEGKGEILRQRDALNRLFVSIDKLIADSTMLAAAGAAGKLDTRADATKHEGDFRKIVEGVNSTLDAVVGPMQDVSATLTKLAGGDFTALVASKYAGDYEHLTNAVNTLSKSVRSALEQIGRNVAALASSAEELNKVSQSMGANADETATQAGVVSAASEQVSSNVQTVATGADEMGASIKEIAKNTAEATRVASAAVRTAEVTNETIAKLGQSSAEVGQVIKVITSIAQQTNLLALNATIEAARAGEAGKGFAVVANEVKELAKETAKATEDISRKIEAIQGDTNGAVSAISQISQVIGQISGIQTTIASAIEEQSATTNEIGRNLAEAAKGSTDISRNIGGVADAARATTIGATDTSKAAHSLEKMAAELQTLVGQFRY